MIRWLLVRPALSGLRSFPFGHVPTQKARDFNYATNWDASGVSIAGQRPGRLPGQPRSQGHTPLFPINAPFFLRPQRLGSPDSENAVMNGEPFVQRCRQRHRNLFPAPEFAGSRLGLSLTRGPGCEMSPVNDARKYESSLGVLPSGCPTAMRPSAKISVPTSRMVKGNAGQVRAGFATKCAFTRNGVSHLRPG